MPNNLDSSDIKSLNLENGISLSLFGSSRSKSYPLP